MKNKHFAIAFIATMVAIVTSIQASASNWACESPNIMDCSDLPSGNSGGTTPCMMPDGTPGITQIGDCREISVYTCNGKNPNCDLGTDCNVMVEYQTTGCEVFCVKNLTVRHKLRRVGFFLGWCASEPLQPGRAMNLKCAIEDVPCTGTEPELMPPTDPVYEPGPGENPVGFQSPVEVPVEP
jgi:hypothetical protein